MPKASAETLNHSSGAERDNTITVSMIKGWLGNGVEDKHCRQRAGKREKTAHKAEIENVCTKHGKERERLYERRGWEEANAGDSCGIPTYRHHGKQIKRHGQRLHVFSKGFPVFLYCLATCPLVYSSTFAAIALCTNPSTDEYPDDVVFSSLFSPPSTLRRKSSRTNLDFFFLI